MMVDGKSIPINSVATRSLEQHGNTDFLSEEPVQAIEALEQGHLLMTRTLALRFGIRVGDRLMVHASEGPVAIEVGGLFSGFDAPGGALRLDIERFDELFSGATSSYIVLWTTSDSPDDLPDQIGRLVTSQNLFFLRGNDLRRSNARVIERYSGLLLVPVSLIAALGVLSLMSLLFGNVVSRGRDLALLNAAGATRADRLAVVLLDGLFLGALGTAAGIAISVPWTSVLADRAATILGFEAVVMIDGIGTVAVGIGGVLLAALSAVAPALYMVRRSGFGGLLRSGN